MSEIWNKIPKVTHIFYKLKTNKNIMKYKLIKEYPNGPKLNTIVEVQKDGYIHWNINSNENSPKNYIHNSAMEQYKEFWEEVIEKDYEIISFYSKDKTHIYDLQSNGRYLIRLTNYNHSFHLRDFINCPIHSVKRLSDGEIFTVGDNTKYGCIDTFYIKNNYLMVTTVLESMGRYLKDIILLKQPLFTTEDGVDIFKSDDYWVVAKKYIYESTVCSEYEYNAFDLIKKEKDVEQYNWDNFWSFSTKEKAEEYILMNKPCLSLNDINNMTTKGKVSLFFMEDLEKLVKQKLKL